MAYVKVVFFWTDVESCQIDCSVTLLLSGGHDSKHDHIQKHADLYAVCVSPKPSFQFNKP